MALKGEELIRFVQKNWKKSSSYLLSGAGYETGDLNEDTEKGKSLNWRNSSVKQFCLEYFQSLASKYGMPEEVFYPKGLPWSFRAEYNLPSSMLKDGLKMTAGSVVDASFMSLSKLRGFFHQQISEAIEQGVLFSVHLKATMLKVSDPIIFGRHDNV